MPIYCYYCHNCLSHMELYREADNRNDMPVCDCGELMDRDITAEFGAPRRAGYHTTIHSVAAGVAPSQVAEHRKLYPDIPINNDGTIPMESHYERKRILKRLGMHDRDGYD